MSFSKRLKKLRLEHEMSQEDIAKKLNITRSAISAYELGRNEPSFEIVNTLADIFNVSVSYLTCKTDDPEASIIETKDFPDSIRKQFEELDIINIGILKELTIADLTEEDLIDLLNVMRKIKNRHV